MSFDYELIHLCLKQLFIEKALPLPFYCFLIIL